MVAERIGAPNDVIVTRWQVVIIQGEAGTGKTRLAAAFLDWAGTQRATLLSGRAFEIGGWLPYQPLAHALPCRRTSPTWCKADLVMSSVA